MTGKERMTAAMMGQPVDRVPIWLREGFDFHRELPHPGDFTNGWRSDVAYTEFFEFAREYCEMRAAWAPGGHFNRMLGIDPRFIETKVEPVSETVRLRTTTIHTPKGDLVGIAETHRGSNTTWQTKYPVETRDDLEKLRNVPFEVAPVSYAGYERQTELLGGRGVLCLGISSPWVVFSNCMPFELALEWSLAERALVHEVLQEITERAMACLRVVLERPLDTIANTGGSEQCTPPMMAPDAYAEFVTPYDGLLVAQLNEHGIPVNCHCHGHVSKALPEMVGMGYACTDPVEPEFGGGDLPIAEARDIVGDRLTLVGNLQFNELAHSSPDQIRRRVREIIDSGKERLILSASAGPISRMSERMLGNYHAWVEEAVVYGQLV